MKINDFSGGFNTRLDPSLLPINTGQVCVNVDTHSGTLKPLNNEVDTGNTLVSRSGATHPRSGDLVDVYSGGEHTIYNSNIIMSFIHNSPKIVSSNGSDYKLGLKGVTDTDASVDGEPDYAPLTVSVEGMGDNEFTLSYGYYSYKIIRYDEDNIVRGTERFLVIINPAYIPIGAVFINADTARLDHPFNVVEYITNNFITKINIDNSKFEQSKYKVYRKYNAGIVRLDGGDVGYYNTKASNAADTPQYTLPGDYKYLAEIIIPAGGTDFIHDIDTENDGAVLNPLDTTLSGHYTYTYTYYNSYLDYESTPMVVDANKHSASSNVGVVITDIVSPSEYLGPNPNDTKIRLYRTGGNLRAFTLITELDADPNGTGLQDYRDSVDDVYIAGNHILDSYDNVPPELGTNLITSHSAMLFACGDNGSNLVYSNVGRSDQWPKTNFINIDGMITGIGSSSIGLFVFTIDNTYLVTGTSPETLSISILNHDYGCVSHNSIVLIAGYLMWVSRNGIVRSNGGTFENISQGLLETKYIGFDSTTIGVLLDSQYYLSYDTGILVYDYKFNKIVKYIATTDYYSIMEHDNKLMMVKDGIEHEDDNRLFEVFGSGVGRQYHWKSGVLTEGDYSNLKKYKDFYIRYNGDVKLSIYLDGKLINQKDLSGNTTYNLKSLSVYGGYGLEIELQGTATVYEITYKVLPRQTGD